MDMVDTKTMDVIYIVDMEMDVADVVEMEVAVVVDVVDMVDTVVDVVDTVVDVEVDVEVDEEVDVEVAVEVDEAMDISEAGNIQEEVAAAVMDVEEEKAAWARPVEVLMDQDLGRKALRMRKVLLMRKPVQVHKVLQEVGQEVPAVESVSCIQTVEETTPFKFAISQE
ncbi:uncharacterized protein [Halyomorpha halys]|uniref:uncharacterized protein n=1 Tax=Halyomorpha halys TaxID=286706 RepID=UPI0034D1DD8C